MYNKTVYCSSSHLNVDFSNSRTLHMQNKPDVRISSNQVETVESHIIILQKLQINSCFKKQQPNVNIGFTKHTQVTVQIKKIA